MVIYNDLATTYNDGLVTYAGLTGGMFTAVYDPTFSRVILTISGLNAATASTVISRWDGAEPQTVVNATIVRGGNLGANTSGVAYDYVFVDRAVETYQVQSFNSSGVLLDSAQVTVTPDNSGVSWLKSIYRPYLNRAVTVTDFSAISYQNRGTLFNVLGQSAPVVVTDVQSTRSLSITFAAANLAEETALQLFFVPGDVIFWQPPGTTNGALLPAAGYFYVATVSDSRRSTYGVHRYFDCALVEGAAPDPAIVGFTATWQGIVANFSTWSAVEAAFATWQAVQAYANPSTTIVS